jgi:hypothetical protein
MALLLFGLHAPSATSYSDLTAVKTSHDLEEFFKLLKKPVFSDEVKNYVPKNMNAQETALFKANWPLYLADIVWMGPFPELDAIFTLLQGMFIDQKFYDTIYIPKKPIATAKELELLARIKRINDCAFNVSYFRDSHKSSGLFSSKIEFIEAEVASPAEFGFDFVQYLAIEQAWLHRNSPVEIKTQLNFFDVCLALPLTNWEEETKAEADEINNAEW